MARRRYIFMSSTSKLSSLYEDLRTETFFSRNLYVFPRSRLSWLGKTRDTFLHEESDCFRVCGRVYEVL